MRSCPTPRSARPMTGLAFRESRKVEGNVSSLPFMRNIFILMVFSGRAAAYTRMLSLLQIYVILQLHCTNILICRNFLIVKIEFSKILEKIFWNDNLVYLDLHVNVLPPVFQLGLEEQTCLVTCLGVCSAVWLGDRSDLEEWAGVRWVLGGVADGERTPFTHLGSCCTAIFYAPPFEGGGA